MLIPSFKMNCPTIDLSLSRLQVLQRRNSVLEPELVNKSEDGHAVILCIVIGRCAGRAKHNHDDEKDFSYHDAAIINIPVRKPAITRRE